MLLEDLRNTREDLERLEQAIAERSLEDPKHVSFHLSQFNNSYSCATVH
jgi:splicing factor 3A subunit 3